MRMSAKSIWLWGGGALAVAWLSLGVGCQREGRLPTAPVRGTVTLDGQPVTEGEVVFLPAAGKPSRGRLDAEGAFVLSAYTSGDGAVIGAHRVGVIARRGEPEEWSEAPTVEWLVPPRYANPATSGLTFEVLPNQENTPHFALVREVR